MNGLERELEALATSIEWPDAPDVAPTVAGRLAVPPPRARRRRRPFALVLAAVLAVLLAVLAVPPARTAILDWLGVGAARIVQVDELPALPPARNLDVLGRRATLAEARAQAGFTFADPPRDEPAPDEVRLTPGLRVSYVWRSGGDLRLLITQFPGRVGDPGSSRSSPAAGRGSSGSSSTATRPSGSKEARTRCCSSDRTATSTTTRAGSPATRSSSTAASRPSGSRARSPATMRSTSSGRCSTDPSFEG